MSYSGCVPPHIRALPMHLTLLNSCVNAVFFFFFFFFSVFSHLGAPHATIPLGPTIIHTLLFFPFCRSPRGHAPFSLFGFPAHYHSACRHIIIANHTVISINTCSHIVLTYCSSHPTALTIPVIFSHPSKTCHKSTIRSLCCPEDIPGGQHRPGSTPRRGSTPNPFIPMASPFLRTHVGDLFPHSVGTLLAHICSSLMSRLRDPGYILAYGRIILSLAQRHGSHGWLEYDRAFRQQAAADPTIKWNSLNPSLMAATVLSIPSSSPSMFCPHCQEVDHKSSDCALVSVDPFLDTPKPHPPQSHRPRPYSRPPTMEPSFEVCRRFNRGTCPDFSRCKYKHICANQDCHKPGHGAHTCPLRSDLPRPRPSLLLK